MLSRKSNTAESIIIIVLDDVKIIIDVEEDIEKLLLAIKNIDAVIDYVDSKNFNGREINISMIEVRKSMSLKK